MLLLFSLTAPAVSGASSDVSGDWQCVAADMPIGDITWTLSIKEEGGELSGGISSEDLGSFRLADPKLDGDTLVFVFYPYGYHVTVTTKLREGKLTGTWQIDGGSGGEFSGEKSTQTK